MNLVTGGTGFTGAHIIYQLAIDSKPVRAIYRAGSDRDFVKRVFSLYTADYNHYFNSIEWVEADMLHYDSIKEAMQGVEAVFHASAVVSFDPRRAKEIIDINVHGTANLVDAAIECGVKRFCHVSSIAALGDANEDGFVTEKSTWVKSKGKSAYSISKFRSEMEVWRGANQGLNVVIVNPGVILGPARWESGSGQYFDRIAKGLPFYTDGVTGYVDVRDVAKVLVELSQHDDCTNQRYILCSDNLSFGKVFTMIANALGKRKPFIGVKPWMISLIVPFVWLLGKLSKNSDGLSTSSLRSGFEKTYYSSDKVRQALGFHFIPIAETIAFTANVYLNEKGLRG
ncbi:MAG: NAD-dependent epimerase/dehydratase family protein [Tenuifilaceae bacterium]|jgi:nucleoside-diphosphate-sugar epimerase|nr:NAD-dependent epimerase/dehydratase family protein [Tenuifilaceae bacterium]